MGGAQLTRCGAPRSRRPAHAGRPISAARGAEGLISSAYDIRFVASRSAFGHRTSETQPSFSKSQIVRALLSSCPLSTPWRAHVGSAWWRLCQDSPNDGMASHHTLRDLSRDSNSSSPMAWQIELMHQVTWCRRAMRTSAPQKNPVAAPHHDMVSSPPRAAGGSREVATQTGKRRLTRLMSLSATRSGQNLSGDVRLLSNSQPMCAQSRPLLSARQSVPKRHGECGSPSLSEYLWWRRCTATLSMTLISMERPPAMPSAIRSQRLALNAPCVKWRWYPAVTPRPDTA